MIEALRELVGQRVSVFVKGQWFGPDEVVEVLVDCGQGDLRSALVLRGLRINVDSIDVVRIQ